MLLTAMGATDILTAIITILVGGITGIAEGIGGGLSTLATSIFLNADQSALSTFGIFVCVFAGISLAVGLSKLVARWISSFGGSRI